MLILVGILYLGGSGGALTAVTWLAQPLLMALVPAGMLATVLAFYLTVPADSFRKSSVRPDISPRATTVFRVTYLTAVFSALAWLTYLTGRPWAIYYFVLWLVPLFTSFSFCMLLRQIVQHGHGGRERFTNTRIFLVSRLIRFAVFPLGMDYHLPHHLFPMVPHYRHAATARNAPGDGGISFAGDDGRGILLASQSAAAPDGFGIDGDGKRIRCLATLRRSVFAEHASAKRR